MLLERGDTPSGTDLKRVREFLKDVERWKADCLEEKTGNAVRNGDTDIWSALCGAVRAKSDKSALLSIMSLIGFGSSKDEETGKRRAKRATAVLRFLDPENWGVVDWRTIAIWSLYNKHAGDMDKAIVEAKKRTKREMADIFDVIGEMEALDMVEKYRSLRTPSLPRTVDVEMAFYRASFIPWPRLK
jgi:hypothetical protein